MHYGLGKNGWVNRQDCNGEQKCWGLSSDISKSRDPFSTTPNKVEFWAKWVEKSAFLAKTLPGGWVGGRRDEPKADQKIVIRSRALCNNYLKWLFHTSGLATSRQRERRSRETSESETGLEKVPSSFVLHCRFDYQPLFRKVSPRFAGRNKVQSRECGGNRA